jgi:hypothetical protein
LSVHVTVVAEVSSVIVVPPHPGALATPAGS